MCAHMQTHAVAASGTTPDLSIVIVAYNCLSWLRGCIASIAGGAGPTRFELIVVDNNSTDGTAEWVLDQCPDAQLIANAENAGFARACNQGTRVSRGRYVLFLNPDTVVHEGALARTLDYMESTVPLAAASCRVLRQDGSLDLSCKRSFPSPWDAFCRMSRLSRLFPNSRLFARYDARFLDEGRRQEVPLIDGCYMMVRRSALEDIGLFDEQFFMYAEEMDWCRRAHERGWKIGYDPSGTITHFKGETTRHTPFRMLYHFHRSMALYCRKHYGRWNPLLLAIYPAIGFRLTVLTLVNLMRADKRVSA